jgi:ribose 5-phosphate isomerase A
MSNVDPVEAAKAMAARRAVAEHFDPSATFVGIGSGTTIVFVVDAIKAVSTNPTIRFVPTGYQSREVIIQAGLVPVALDALPEGQLLDVAFDGADEVDESLNCIKGGGACLFQEKLVVERAKKFVCVADYRKAQSRLLTSWPSIPIEVAPIAAPQVLTALRALGSPNPLIRPSTLAKTGPLKTDQDFYIIDAPFAPLLTAQDVTTATASSTADAPDSLPHDPSTLAPVPVIETPIGIRWQVEELARRIKEITGVLEVGLFSGPDGPEAMRLFGRGGQKPVAVYFGMRDGSVEVRGKGAATL